MPYTIKLKNQTGTEVTYNSVEQVAIPLASGSGNATFMARYDVTKETSTNITYYGGSKAAHGIDYLCRISSGSSGKVVADSISVSIGGSVATVGKAYEYTKLSNSEAIVKINGTYITGAVSIKATAS